MKLTMLGTGFATATKCYNTCFALSNEQEHFLVDACETAQRLGVKNLILYHTEDKNLAQRKARYTEEGKQYYRGNLKKSRRAFLLTIASYICRIKLEMYYSCRRGVT